MIIQSKNMALQYLTLKMIVKLKTIPTELISWNTMTSVELLIMIILDLIQYS